MAIARVKAREIYCIHTREDFESDVLSEVEERGHMYSVYILKNKRGDMYIGQTNDLSRRLFEHSHRSQKSAKFIKDSNDAFTLVYAEHYDFRIEAMHREKQLKRWTRAKKEALIAQDLDLLKRL